MTRLLGWFHGNLNSSKLQTLAPPVINCVLLRPLVVELWTIWIIFYIQHDVLRKVTSVSSGCWYTTWTKVCGHQLVEDLISKSRALIWSWSMEPDTCQKAERTTVKFQFARCISTAWAYLWVTWTSLWMHLIKTWQIQYYTSHSLGSVSSTYQE
jgi:hypothetical protein